MAVLFNNEKSSYGKLESSEDSAELQNEICRPRRTLYRAACIVGVIVSCALSFVAGRYTQDMSLQQTIRSPVPHIPLSPVTFQANPQYSGPSSRDSDTAWTALLPPNEGFILIPNPSPSSNLQPGKPTPQGSSTYDLSVFHQLHCLIKIREHLSLLRFAYEQNNTQALEKLVNPQARHMDHCFDYLRQGIMCAGDMTLEWPKEGSKNVVDGWGVTHQCKNWDAIWKFAAVEERQQ